MKGERVATRGGGEGTPLADSAYYYFDRESGRLLEQAFYRQGLFRWLYGSRPGRVLREGLARSGTLHRLLQRFADSSLSRPLIGTLLRAGDIDPSEAEFPTEHYRSLNAFFTRRLKPGCRPLDSAEGSFIAPADGKLQVVPIVDLQQPMVIKGVATRIGDLLASGDRPRRYLGGSALVVRLYLGDCHRFVFPAAGEVGPARLVPGRYYSVSPFPGNTVDFYRLNRRMVTQLTSEPLGCCTILMVGGFLISSIRPRYVPGLVDKGGEHGCFAFGGSTLIYLTEPEAVRYDDDIVANSNEGLETRVKMGSRIGTVH